MPMTYVFPQLAAVYHALGPAVEALLRVTIALCLIPHGLRMYLGWFPNTGMPVNSLAMLVDLLDHEGFRPGKLWAPVIVTTELIGGPMLALGLFTRAVALPVFILLMMSVLEHRKSGWFWNTQGIEYPLIWAMAALYFLVNGGGIISLDHRIGWEL